MPYRSYTKEEPSALDLEIYALQTAQGMTRQQIADYKGISVEGVDYHLSEARRLSNIDMEKFVRLCKSSLIPLTVSTVQGMLEEMNRQRASEKVDLHAGVKILRGMGVMSETVNAKIQTLPESTIDPERLKRELAAELFGKQAVDAEVVDSAPPPDYTDHTLDDDSVDLPERSVKLDEVSELVEDNEQKEGSAIADAPK